LYAKVKYFNTNSKPHVVAIAGLIVMHAITNTSNIALNLFMLCVYKWVRKALIQFNSLL